MVNFWENEKNISPPPMISGKKCGGRCGGRWIYIVGENWEKSGF